MSNNWFDTNPLIPAALREQIAGRYATFTGIRMEASGDGAAGDGGTGGSGEGDGGGRDETFTQADVDAAVEKIAAKIRAEERQKVSKRYADYDDLKAKAEGAKTAEERMAELEKEIATTKHEALKRRVQAAHQISDEDADLFLTGTDEESLTAQAKRLADRESERKKGNNRVSREGHTPNPRADSERDAVRALFGSGE